MTEPTADLVLEGGGVKGVALVGALTAFARAGYRFERIAGTSAGAIAGAVAAAMERAGEPVVRLEEVAATLDNRRLRDRGTVAAPLAALGLGPLVDGLAIALEDGIFEGDYLTGWLRGVLRDLGVVTFGDLALPADSGAGLPEGHRYRLVVTASDLSRQRLARLPWDYPEYGLDPDEQRVADAVRASASMPFYFEPVRLQADPARGVSTLVDGGLLSNFPIAIFDRTDGEPPRWPTFGVRLSGRTGRGGRAEAVTGPIALARALIETMLNADDAQSMSDPCNAERSVFIDTSTVSAVDFGIDAGQRQELVDAGRRAVEAFLRGWDFQHWRRHCRGGTQ